MRAPVGKRIDAAEVHARQYLGCSCYPDRPLRGHATHAAPADPRISVSPSRQRLRLIGKDSPNGALGNALGAQHVVERDQLARKSTGGQVLSDRTPHGGTLNGLPLDGGDLAPVAAFQLGRKLASPLAPARAAINVLGCPRPIFDLA
jgi:hypothetical protein